MSGCHRSAPAFALKSAFLICSIMLLAQPAASKESKFALAFPVMIEAPTINSIEQTENGKAIYSQILRAAGAIVIKADIPVRVETGQKETLWTAHPGPYDFVVPAGTKLVKAMWKGDVVYCTSKVVNEGFGGYFDAGICLRDADNDGVLESLFVTDQWPDRINTVINIRQLREDAPTAVSVQYDALGDLDVPTFELRIWSRKSGGLFATSETFQLGLCVPPTIGLPKDGDALKEVCNKMDWSASGLKDSGPLFGNAITYEAREKIGEKGELRWGPIRISYSALAGGHFRTNSEASLPIGDAYLVDVGAMYFGRYGYANPIAIMHLLRPSAQPQNPAGARGAI